MTGGRPIRPPIEQPPIAGSGTLPPLPSHLDCLSPQSDSEGAHHGIQLFGLSLQTGEVLTNSSHLL